MLYGRTNPNQVWEFKKFSNVPQILYNENNKVVSIPGLLDGLKEKSDTGLFYYVFSYMKQERFVFVTTEKVDYLALNNPANMVFSGIVMYVKGALWDLEKEQYVSFNRPEGYFNTFMVYDAGVPNIVFDEAEKKYTIFALDNDKYVFYENKTRYQPPIVSHLWKNNKVGRPVHNRLIFITRENDTDENMLILHEEIELDSFNEGVAFVETIPLNTESDSDEAYFRSVHGKDVVGSEVKEAEPYLIKHLVFEDAVVVQQVYGDYNIVFVKEGNVIYDADYDCVDYDKVIQYNDRGEMLPCKENVVMVFYNGRDNDFDFERHSSSFNITTDKITDID